MATETRTFINLSDLSGIEFECRNCNAKILYPIQKHYQPLSEKCPSCKKPLFDNNPELPSDQPQIVELVQKTIISLHNISETPAVKAHVRLYVEEGREAPTGADQAQKPDEPSSVEKPPSERT
jgi:phage FluMu protein Com